MYKRQGVVKGEGDLAGLVHGLVGGGAQPIGIELAAVQESQQGLLGIWTGSAFSG